MTMMRAEIENKGSSFSQLRLAECSPEKAGVGGSIPSLATTFSISYNQSERGQSEILRGQLYSWRPF